MAGSMARLSWRAPGVLASCCVLTRACDHDPRSCDQDSIACSLATRPCDDGLPYYWRIPRACDEGTRPCCRIPWPCDQTRRAWDGIPGPPAVITRGLIPGGRPCIKGTRPCGRDATGPWDAITAEYAATGCPPLSRRALVASPRRRPSAGRRPAAHTPCRWRTRCDPLAAKIHWC